MRVLIAPDKFKGSLTAPQVCDAIEAGVLTRFPEALITKLPLADGGEGTMKILTEHANGELIQVDVHGPLFQRVHAEYGLDAEGTAYIEMAAASGLQLLEPAHRNPASTSTFGTGELMLDAIERGAKRVILGIGGSATNDAGIGMAAALGYRFLDSQGKELEPVGKNLAQLAKIDASGAHVALQSLEVIALCDVNNPLFGEHGAAYVYGPQKGANPETVIQLDHGLRVFNEVATQAFGRSPDFAGAGAGGGIAGGASVFFRLQVRPGIDFIFEKLHVSDQIEAADLIITGEGKMDRQTLAGKVVATVAREGLAAQKKVFAVCGICELRKNETTKMGITDVLSLTDPFTSPEEAITHAFRLIGERVAGGIS